MQNKAIKRNMQDMRLQKKQNPFALHKNSASKTALPKVSAVEVKPIQRPARSLLIAAQPEADDFVQTVNHQSVSRPATARYQGVGAFLIIAAVIGLTFQGVSIVASGLNTKGMVLGTATDAVGHLTEAKDLIAQKDFLGAEQQFEFAQKNFIQAKEDVDSMGLLLAAVLKVTPQGKTATHLLNAGEQLSLAGMDFNNFYQLTTQVHTGADGLSAPDGFYYTVNAAKKYLSKADTELQQASAQLSDVDPGQLPGGYQLQYDQYKEKLGLALQGADQLTRLLDLFQQFIGNGPKSILVLFENNNELRPGGGFIGTYGFFKLNDGKIISQKISSVYDLDGQITDKIAPPGPFHDLTDHWGLRDSNWFADFSSSAKKSSMFYDMVGHETPDAVIAVTPDLFVDMLRVLGPVYMQQYNLTLSADNFRDQVQLNTSVLYDKSANKPKQMLADFAPLFLQAMSRANDQSHSELLAVLLNNLYKKNILFYDRDPSIEQGFQNYNWAGQIASTDRDYFAVVNANLGGKKTDLDIGQSADIKSEVQSDGSIINTLTYSRSHKLNFNQFDKNIDFVRFLVPQGSTLVSAQGFVAKPFYQADGKGYLQQLGQPFMIDPDLQAFDRTESFDTVSSTTTGQESGKTFFGGWMEVAPGESQTVTLRYKLPFKISDSRKYSLLLQKQPGSTPVHLSYSLNSGNDAVWYEPQNLVQKAGKISYNQDLLNDTLIGLVFR